QRTWQKLINKGSARANRCGRPRLALEAMEDRCVPATTWIGPQGGLWSTAANWSSGVPTFMSDVKFGSALGGTNTDSVDNLDLSSGLDSLTIDASYGHTITVNSNLNLAIVNGGTATQASGTLSLSSSASIQNLGTYLWTGGSIVGGGTFVNVLR